MEYGTEEQKKKFIPDILDSKVTWCTGYSEPNHGSDLAATNVPNSRVITIQNGQNGTAPRSLRMIT